LSLPAAARRLFPGYDEPSLEAEPARGLLFARLLEDGEGAEVGWLFERFGEAAVARWVAGHGHRQLSQRSRTFWAWLLGCALAAAPEAAEALWPL